MITFTASVSSPFVRKVYLAVAIKGVSDRVVGVAAEQDETLNREIRSSNPLFKLPTMKLEDGRIIHDSHVICEYIDSLTPDPRLFPSEIDDRIETLTLASLGDGIIEAALSVVLERRFRPEEKWVQAWIDRQQRKVDAGIDWLEANVPQIEEHPNYGHLTTAAALGYLDFRQDGAWRSSHPRLVAWLNDFAMRVPAFETTTPPKA